VPRTLPGDAGDPHGMTRAVADYLETLAVRGYSPRTVEDRRHHLSAFIVWCAERGVTRPSEVTRPVLERYQRHLFHLRKANGAPVSFRSQYGRLIPIRGLFRYLARANRVLSNPAADLDMPKLDRRLPKATLTAAEAELVLAQPDLTDPLGVRDRAILEVLYSTGIRRAECMALSVWDLDAERGTLMIRLGKGRKDRVVPIGARAVAWVERYLVEVRPGFVVEPDDGTLFLTRDGFEFRGNRLSSMVAGYVDAADIGKTGSCHLFRHTMATLMLEGGADVRYIQEILGHAQLSTTEIYTRVSILALKAIHDACHPAATNTRHRNSHDGDAAGELLDALAAEHDDDNDDEIDDPSATREAAVDRSGPVVDEQPQEQ
jgi:integrase/recombinase XerD